MPDSDSTAGEEYAARLQNLTGVWWKRVLDVQLPWRVRLRRLALGRVLDVGCGIGRNLASLDPSSVGVDHNAHSIEVARRAGHNAVTVDEFLASPELTAPHGFDSMLVAHVIEHLEPEDAIEILAGYLPMIRPGGRVVLVCPQERGYGSDATHVTFTDFAALQRIATRLGLEPVSHRSFPFGRWAGRSFTYNEFWLIGRVPAV